jgi:hypothetical protein
VTLVNQILVPVLVTIVVGSQIQLFVIMARWVLGQEQLVFVRLIKVRIIINAPVQVILVRMLSAEPISTPKEPVLQVKFGMEQVLGLMPLALFSADLKAHLWVVLI